MSSSGIQAVSSGPLIIRTYNTSGSSDVTYVLQDYDYPVSSNYVLITSTNGQLVPSNNIYVSSITTSSFNSDFIRASTAYLSSVFGFSPVQFYSPVRINNTNPATDGPQLFVNGSTVFSEPGAQSTPQIAGVNIFGLPNGNTINTNFTNSTLYTINEPVTKLNFQLIGAGGSDVNGNNTLNVDLPGIGTYISGTLAVKQGDKLQIFTGTVGDASNGSKGTSLIYLSSVGGGIFVSTLVCVAGAGGGNGYAQAISSSSGGGHGGGGSGGVTTSGNVDYYAFGIVGYDGISTSNGNYQTYADGGQGGINNPGPSGGYGGGQQDSKPFAGTNGQFSSITSILTTGGLVNGGAGGTGSTRNGGFGGGGYLGGGGGQGGINVSAGGGGGATYIAVSTLSNYLSNLVCLGGQWISQNNATPFGQDYGLPNNPGYVEINGYQPNDTLYTNGDIECRVLRYEMLDPPINAIGGASALWAIYPAIDIVHMNDNPIVECGGIEVDKGGINVSNFIRIEAGANDTFPNGGMCQFIRATSSGASTIDYQVGTNSTGFGLGNIWQDARYVYNPSNIPNDIQVWGIVTSSNITNVGPSIGDIHFYNGVYIDGKVGIGVGTNPSTTLQVLATDESGLTGLAVKSGDVNTTIGAYSEGWFLNDNVGSLQATRVHNSTFYTLAINPRGGDVYIGSTINDLIIFSASTTLNELIVTGTSEFQNQVSTLNQITVTQNGINITGNSVFNNILCASTLCTSTLSMSNGNIQGISSINSSAGSLNIVANEISTIGNLTVTGSLTSIDISPVGAINLYAGAADPPGWLICDGRQLLVNATYNSLFSIIGTTFGGDGPPATYFNIPDMTNRFPIGSGTGYNRGQSGGGTATLTEANLPSHRHGIVDVQHSHTATQNLKSNNTLSGDNNNVFEKDVQDDDTQDANFQVTIAPSFTGITSTTFTGSGTAFNVVPAYLSLNYIIKY